MNRKKKVYNRFTHGIACSDADGQVLDAGDRNTTVGMDNFVYPCACFLRDNNPHVDITDDGFEIVFLGIQGLSPAVYGMLLGS